ncbi:MAG: hypothetical protein J6O56_05435 [Bacilli bacterium]|nr:hypothetical protein [Bacilli bacterium]
MSYKNYAAINKINKLQNELDEYKQNKIEVKEEKEEIEEKVVEENQNFMTLDSILSQKEEPKKVTKVEKEIEDYPRFATITGAQALNINFYDLGNLVRQYEEVFPNEDKKLA